MMITSSFLNDLKRKAIRGKVWFRSLDGLERGILNLSAKILDVVDKVSCLGIELTKIVTKIEDALKSLFERRLESYGFKRAGEIIKLAIRFGYYTALRWFDDSFTRYVTFMSLNIPLGWNF
jgi:hypothetical protein